MKYTYFGDADLNGKIDGTDYSKIDAGFNSGNANPDCGFQALFALQRPVLPGVKRF